MPLKFQFNHCTPMGHKALRASFERACSIFSVSKKSSYIRARSDPDFKQSLNEIAQKDQYASVSDMVRKVLDDFVIKSIKYKRVGENQYIKRKN
jgi:hypothetical protein